MLTITGQRRSGTNSAHKNLVSQKVLLAKKLPEISAEILAWHNGTLNFNLDKLLVVARPDYLASVDWAPNEKMHAGGEMFGLVRCRMEILESGTMVPAFIYIAHHSEWRKRPYVHEIVAPTVKISQDGAIKLHIDREFRTVAYPWRERGEVVILE